MEKNQEIEHSSEASRVVGKILHLATYPVSAVVGYMAGDVVMRNNVYRNFAKHGFFDARVGKQVGGLQGDTHEEIVNIVRDAYKGRVAKATSVKECEGLIERAVKFDVFKPEELKGFSNTGDHFRQAFANLEPNLGKIESSNIKALDRSQTPIKRFAELTNAYRQEVRQFFEDIGIKNWRSYFKATNRNQKVEAAVFALTAAGISLGAMLTLSNSRGVLDELKPTPNKDISR